jgi:hypothetical protein
MEDLSQRKGLTPNLTSRMSKRKRNKWKEKYSKFKKGFTICSPGAATAFDAKAFARDLVTSKLKIRAYKLTFFVLLGPYIQILACPFYMLSSIRKLRIIALSLSDLGAKITAGEMNAMNLTWIGADFIIFDEPVPIVNSTDLMLFRNESSVIDELLEVLE